MLQAYLEWNNFSVIAVQLAIGEWNKVFICVCACACVWVCVCVNVHVCECACVAVMIRYLSSQIYILRLQPELGSDNELNVTCMCIPLRVTYDSCLFVGWEPPTTVTSEYPPSITLRALVQGRNTCYTWGRMPWQLSRAVYLRAEVPLTCILEMAAPVSAVLRLFSFYSVFCRRIVR